MPSWTSSHAIASVAHSRRKHPKKGRPTRARIAESSRGSSCAPSRRPRIGVRPADLMPCRTNDKVQIANELVSFYRVPNQSYCPPAGGYSRDCCGKQNLHALSPISTAISCASSRYLPCRPYITGLYQPLSLQKSALCFLFCVLLAHTRTVSMAVVRVPIADACIECVDMRRAAPKVG